MKEDNNDIRSEIEKVAAEIMQESIRILQTYGHEALRGIISKLEKQENYETCTIIKMVMDEYLTKVYHTLTKE